MDRWTGIGAYFCSCLSLTAGDESSAKDRIPVFVAEEVCGYFAMAD